MENERQLINKRSIFGNRYLLVISNAGWRNLEHLFAESLLLRINSQLSGDLTIDHIVVRFVFTLLTIFDI